MNLIDCIVNGASVTSGGEREGEGGAKPERLLFILFGLPKKSTKLRTR